MIIGRGKATTVAEHPELAILAEQPHRLAERKYPDSLIFGWMKGVPQVSAEDRMEADRLSVTRQMEGVFA